MKNTVRLEVGLGQVWRRAGSAGRWQEDLRLPLSLAFEELGSLGLGGGRGHRRRAVGGVAAVEAKGAALLFLRGAGRRGRACWAAPGGKGQVSHHGRGPSLLDLTYQQLDS